MPYFVADYNGFAVAKKLSGAGPVTVGTQVTIPFSLFATSNPTGTAYPILCNANASISNDVLGIRSPTFAVQCPVKASWWSANLLNSWLSTTDFWAWGVSDGTTLRTFDQAQCAGITVTASAAGGAIGVELAWMALYDSKFTGGWTFSTFTAGVNDPGALSDVSKVSFASSADQVPSFQLSLLRARSYLQYFSPTIALHNSAIGSGILTGSLSLPQSASATTVPSSGATIQIGSTGAGVQFAPTLNLDNYARNYTPGLGLFTNTYTCVDLTGGGNICPITSL